MTIDPSGFVDYSDPNAIPDIAQEDKQSASFSVDRVEGVSFKPQAYKPSEVPYMGRVDLWGPNGYYMNGPSWRPYADAQNKINQIKAYTQSWTPEARVGPVTDFFKLLEKYGATNNAGVLWSMAANGIGDNTTAGQKILGLDAQNYYDANTTSGPMAAGSPSANQQPVTEAPEPSALESFVEPYQFGVRNLFSAAFMPLQAVQGVMRGVGAALTEEGGPDIGEALGQIASIIPPVAAVIDGYVFDDNDFVNPWEQTDFGQQLIAMSNGAGFDAFTSMTAGLDLNRAKQELLQNPENANLMGTAEGMAELDYRAQELALEKEYYARPGWFIDPDSQIGEAQRQATFNSWAIPGPNDQLTAWTLGRGIFSNVGGPDWAGYSVASGLVDAAASIFFDPITYIPFANVASAVTKGTKVAGAFSKNATKIANTNEQLLKLVEKSDPEYATVARNAAITFRQENGRDPNFDELQEIVGPAPEVDVASLQKMSLEEQMSLVRGHMEAELVKEAYTASYGRSTKARVSSLARQAFRNFGSSERMSRVISGETKKGPLTPEEQRMRYVWSQYLGSFNKDGSFSLKKYNTFQREVLGLDPRTKEFTNVENLNAFNEVNRLHYRLAQTGRAALDGTEDSALDVSIFMTDNFGRRYRQEFNVDPAQVATDVANLYARGTPEEQISGLAEFSGLGATLADDFTGTGPVVGLLDGVETAFYYSGTRPLRIANAADVVPPRVLEHVRENLSDVAARVEANLPQPVTTLENLRDQTAARFANTLAVSTQLNGLLDTPNLTYRALLNFAVATGLDSVLDDALRTVPRTKIDGIRGVTGLTGNGVWVGNHPQIVGYSIGEASQAAGISLRGADDIDAALSGLQATSEGIAKLGYKATDIPTLLINQDETLTAFGRNVDNINKEFADALVLASKEQQTLDDATSALDAKFADPVQAARTHLAWDFGLRNHRTGGLVLDPQQTRYALFGTGPSAWFANKTLEVLSEFIPQATRERILAAGVDSDEYAKVLSKAMGDLHIVTGGKWSPEAYRAVATNSINSGGVDGLLAVIAPRIGVDISKGSISRGLKSTGSDTSSYFRSWRATNPVIARGLSKIPVSMKLELADTERVADTITSYAKQAGIRLDEVSENIGQVLAAAGTPGVTAVSRNALVAVFDKINERLIAQIRDQKTTKALFSGEKGRARLNEVERAISDSTKLWINGLKETRSADIAAYAADAKIAKVVTPDGSVDLPARAIETDIANGYVMLPTVDEWNKAHNRFALALSRMPVTENTYELSRKFYDNFFRTSLLVFRISYILRNAAEMQVRMFLNGHKSVVSDPATMIGMTIGNLTASRRVAKYNKQYEQTYTRLLEQTGKEPKPEEITKIIGNAPVNDAFARLIAPYKDTVLKTSFEVGKDDALATTNYVMDYYELTRLAHSLTDVRVYNSAVVQGFDYKIAYGTSGFNDGWAHELMMLERSKIARGVARAQTQQQQDDYVKFLRESPEARDTRDQMIAFDENFKKVFADQNATRQYLFDLPNSVFNRIRIYTNNDPRLLEYIATGRLRYSGGSIRTGSIRTPEERISRLAQVLRENFNDQSFEQHFISNSVRVANMVGKGLSERQGFYLVNRFFDLANKFERIGSVGPEYRMAYWDKIATLAPMLRASDVDKALDAARTTLGPIKRLIGPSAFDNIGQKHPAFAALRKAKKENTDGTLTLDEIHNIAAGYAAEDISRLFYDATKRNNWWYALRLLFPFGQAWGNTVTTWTGLAAKQPINVYRALKAFNALVEDGSSAIYEFGSETNTMYGQYAPGFAPWEQSVNGGFFYTDAYGDTSFMLPFVGRAAAMPLKIWSMLTGTPVPDEIPIQSPAQSLNFALGADSILPGVSGVAALPLAQGVLPDSDIVSNLRQIVQPFGERDLLQTAIPPWLAKTMSGMGSIPILGDMFGPFVDSLSQSNKAANIRDAMLILSTSGNYKDWGTNPETAQRMREDAADLARVLLLTTGLLQNVSPSTPVPQLAAQMELPEIDGKKQDSNVALYTIGMLNSLFQQYKVRNGYDDTAAREEFVQDFGPSALFASVGMWKNITKVPTSDALKFARQHPEIARANIDIFGLFFPGGDQSDVAAVAWAKKNGVGDRVRKNKDEIYDEIISYLQRVQNFRINSMEAAGVVNEDEAEAAREEVAQRYLETASATGVYVNKTQEMEQLNAFARRYQEIQNAPAGQAFLMAWDIRAAALRQVREQTGDPDAGLGSNAAEPIYNWYVGEISKIESQYPDFRLLASRFRREWL